MVPVAVIELDEPHAALGQPPGQQAVRGERAVAPLRAVHLQHVLPARREMSISSGTLVCMRKAISYWLMRVAISGSAAVSLRSWLSSATASTTSRCLPARHAVGIADVQHRVALAAELDPLEPAGQKAGVPLPRGDRLLLAEIARRHHDDEARQARRLAPQAHSSSHEPIDGRPAIIEPVFMNVWAGSWLIASVCIERTMHISSAIVLPMLRKHGRDFLPALAALRRTGAAARSS